MSTPQITPPASAETDLDALIARDGALAGDDGQRLIAAALTSPLYVQVLGHLRRLDERNAAAALAAGRTYQRGRWPFLAQIHAETIEQLLVCDVLDRRPVHALHEQAQHAAAARAVVELLAPFPNPYAARDLLRLPVLDLYPGQS